MLNIVTRKKTSLHLHVAEIRLHSKNVCTKSLKHDKHSKLILTG